MKLTIATINCGMTKKCANRRCFWRWRDLYGLIPWQQVEPGQGASNAKKYLDLVARFGGEADFPKMTTSVGADGVDIVCHGYVGPKK